MAYSRTTTSSYMSREKYMADNYVISYNTPTYTFTNNRSGEKVENFKEIIRNGGNATGDYSLDAVKLLRSRPGTFGVQTRNPYAPYNSNRQIGTGLLHAPSTNLTISGVNASKAKAIALAKIYKKIQSEVSHMNSLASLAEFHDVIRQFGAPAEAIVDLSNKRLNRLALERRGLSGSVNFKQTQWHRILASTWLEYSLGLAPLIEDTKDAAEALARFQFERTGEARFRKKIMSRGIDQTVTVTPNMAVSTPCTWVFVDKIIKDTVEARCQYICGLQTSTQADFGSNERLLQLLGITPGNLITAAWEAVPWSWLLDYFANINAILEASATSTTNVTWICETVTSRMLRETIVTLNTQRTTRAVGDYGHVVSGFTSEPAGSTVLKTVLTRKKQVQLGVPPLTYRLPTKPKQLANMVALLFARRAKSSDLWLF